MQISQLQPINNSIIIKPINQEETTASGIIFSDANKDMPIEGEIIAVSPDIKAPLKAGDKVIYKKYAPREIEINDQIFLAAELEDIIAIINHE